MTYDNWQKDPYAVKWLSKLGDRTRENACQDFPKLLEWCGKTPTELIKMKVNDLQTQDPTQKGKTEDLVIEFKKFLETQNYKRSTIKTVLNRVQSFFSHNRVKLSFARGDLSVEPSESEKVTQEWILDNVEIRALYGVANVRDRALLLTLYQSGLSEIDVSSLNIEHLTNIYEHEGHLYIDKLREKTNIHQKTCISSECVHDIKNMLRERGAKKGALFVSEKGQRLTVRFINEAMKNLCSKAYPERVSEFKTKSLRSSYNDALLQANLTQETKDTLFGHQRQSARKSYHISKTTVLQAYQKAFKYLSINHGAQSKKDIERIEQTVIGLAETITEQQKQLKEMSSEISELKTMIGISSIEAVHEKVKALQKAKNQT